MSEPRLLLDGLAFPESPRWHDGRLWVADWAAHEVLAVDPAGRSEVVARVESFPLCFDHLPDGRALIVSSQTGQLLRRDPDGALAPYADLRALSSHAWNDIVVDGRGHAYVNNIGFDFGGGASAGDGAPPGIVALVTADGAARVVAEGLAFPNGMAVTPDNGTLIVAESHGRRLTAFDIAADGELANRRVWADLGDGAPDGICLDAEGALWYADVPHRQCVRVREGGEVLATIAVDRGCFACVLGGDDGRTLFIAANEWRGPESMASGTRHGRVVTAEAPSPRAGWP